MNVELKQIGLTIVGVILANIFTYLISQGFVHSKWGRNARQEVTRWFNQLANLFRRK